MQFKDTVIDLSTPKVMGILNVTPDSFSDGGHYKQLDMAIKHAEKMASEGAVFIDVGGESTRPGAADVSLQQELDRVIPVIEKITTSLDVIVSIDTSKADVMREAVKAGAGLINDVRALQEEGALRAAAEANVPICLMHMQGQPRTMQNAPSYENVVEDVMLFLRSRIEACVKAGINDKSILLDPGFGFGKRVEDNYQILKHLAQFSRLACPLLVGLSRKSMLGAVTQRDVDERLAGSIAGATLCALNGASVIRVHDVKETVDAVSVVTAMQTL
ncbi:dihydropteroate synthase [Aestuariibacter sp. AA17]|uniref:Dihydropteroate synthase n=1 Tax=Fluctibacter corallii TaxID=2984329 RepID=A0ABT3A5S5_9ALTE|nr:dihydropteroate synthase [Aestuariibacter sp. AA17]MCV2883985.1 dihydropteroate synthase [Aestuariibacter sp. AA17]